MRRRDFIVRAMGLIGAGSSGLVNAQKAPCPPPLLQTVGGGSVSTSCDDGLWKPPYSLPGAGQVVGIGSNSHHSITPAGWTTAQWDGANFNSYGGGTFVPTYSQAGAYVIAGSGGHNHSDNYDAVVFDFEIATWARLQNANGVNLKTGNPLSISDNETNGAPYYEITVDGSGNPSAGGTATQVPAPPHPYGHLAYIPEGTKGSVLYFGRAAAAVGAHNAQGIHKFDLATRLWSRYGSALNNRVRTDTGNLYDPDRNRVWFSETFSFSGILYLDLNDQQAKTAGSFSTPSGQAYICHLVLHDGLLVAFGNGTNAQQVLVMDPESPTGWASAPLSGTMPTNGGAHRNKWVRYSNGNYYWMPRTGGNVVWRLRPPANPFTGTWQVDTVTVSGPTMGYRWESNAHYTLLCYVPAIDCLAWIPGGSEPVYIFMPPA